MTVQDAPAKPPVPALLALGALAGCAALWVAVGPLGGVPHVSDEVAYTLQSRLFAGGMRVGPAADNASMLSYPFWAAAPGSYSVFPPGWPALLSVAERLRAPWGMNPLLAAFLPALSYALARPLVERRVALLSAGVMACSPAVLLLASSRMSHTSVLVALLIAAVVVLRRSPTLAWWGAGAAVAYVVTARPFDAVLLGGPLLLAGLWRADSWARRLPLVLLPGLAAGAILTDNHNLTGHALTFPVGPWYDSWVQDMGRPAGCNRLGFGETVGCNRTWGSWGHTPLKALKSGMRSALTLDRTLLGVTGAFIPCLMGAWKLRRHPLLLVPIPLVALGYALYWSGGVAYGARFWHPMLIVLPLLLAQGLHSLLRRWAWTPLLVLPLAGGSGLLPDLADRYWCVDPSLKQLLAEQGVTEGVVFLRGVGARQADWPALGVDDFQCNDMLEAGDGLLLMDPTRSSGGLQLRHALPDLATTQAYLRLHHPGASAWIAHHDIRSDQRTLQPISP